MIQNRTMLKVADNSGAKILQCVQVLGGTRHRYAQLGDIIVGVVKKAEPRKIVKKHEVTRAVIIRQKKAYRRLNGTYIRFDVEDTGIGIAPDAIERISSRTWNPSTSGIIRSKITASGAFLRTDSSAFAPPSATVTA